MSAKSLIDDMMTLGGGLLSGLADARHELKAQLRAKADHLLRDCDLVTRDEFDAAFAMLAKARAMQEELAERLTRLEEKAGIKPAAADARSPSARQAARPAANRPATARKRS